MENEFIFFDATEYASNLKCTIQKSGKIGFTSFTQVKMKMREGMSIKIGIKGAKENVEFLVFQFLDNVDENAFKLNKAGSYYYINPKVLLDELKINYTGKNISYDMVPINEDLKMYKLIRKDEKNQKNEDNAEV